MPADVVREAVARMPPHVQRYVVEKMRADLAGGRMSERNAEQLEQLYRANPKATQRRFTGEALLNQDVKRLRPKQAQEFWTTKRVMKENAAPPPTAPTVVPSKRKVLDETFAAVGPTKGAKAFWEALKEASPEQRRSVEARAAAREFGADTVPPSYISWKEASDYYQAQGGQPYNASVTDKQDQLTQQQKTVLNNLFYGKYRAGIGLRALWQALADTPRQTEHIAANNGRGWISFGALRAWYLKQEITQVMRNAPVMTDTKVRVPTPDELVPMRRMQADSISFVGQRSGQYGGLLHVIDLFSQYTWAVPVVTVGSTSNTAAAFKKILAQVTERYGADALPEEIDLQTDNGPEFGAAFAKSLPSSVKLRKIPANTPNKAGAVENSNKVWRGVMRRLLKKEGAALNKWSVYTPEATEVVNSRPNQTLSVEGRWLAPADVFSKVIKGDTELLEKVRKGIIGSANSRRAPGNVTAYEPGTTVRVADASYLKSSLKSNEQKMDPKWSEAVFTVKTIKANRDNTMIPEYLLEAAEDTPETRKLLKPPQGDTTRWHSHDMLQRVYGVPEKVKKIRPPPPDEVARPFATNPSVAAPPRRSQRQAEAPSDRRVTRSMASGDLGGGGYLEPAIVGYF